MHKTNVARGSLLLCVGVCTTLACKPHSIPEDPSHATSSAESTQVTLATNDAPNVILFSIDTLRKDHLGCYGYAQSTSPTVDEIAKEGVVFENNISSTSWTLPSHAALFTSLPDTVHGCVETDKRLSGKLTTLAERYRDAGYATAGFFAGPYLHPAFGLAQGFDHYENCTSYGGVIDNQPAAEWAMDEEVMKKSHQDITNPIVYKAVRKWMLNRPNKPFFVFIHLWDVHFDFIPPGEYATRFDPDYKGSVTGRDFFFDSDINAQMPQLDKDHLEALYDGEICWTDAHVASLYEDLRNAGLLDSTIIAITADHGTEFFEHGGKAHRMTLFDEVIRTPLVIRYPKVIPAGRRVACQSRIIDIGPTLLELSGLDLPKDAMGHSLVSIACGGDLNFDNIAISELYSVGRRMRTLRTLNLKFVEDLARKDRYYFDLKTDPKELHRLSDWTSPDGRYLLNKYKEKMRELTEASKAVSADPGASPLPDDVLKQLESLGYIGGSEPPNGSAE